MSRISNEIAHGKKIEAKAESVWGWETRAGRIRAERRANYLLEFGGFAKGSKALEIGCGTGLFTQKVDEQSNVDITAIDISEDLLSQGRQKLPHINFIVKDAMNTGFNDRTFDTLFGSSVLHHLDMGLALKEAYRIMKPGAVLVFAEPNMLNPQIFLERKVGFLKDWLGVSPDETAIIRWSMVKMLSECGFTEARVFTYDFLHPYTPNFMIPFVNWFGRILERIPLVKEIAGSVIIFARKPHS